MPLQIRDFLYAHHKRGDHDVLYEISDEYNASIAGFTGDYEYYGYVNNMGGWIIQRNKPTTGEWRYVIGESDYLTNWGARIGKTYDTYNKMFIQL